MPNFENKWTRADAPPPPLFLGQKERNLVKQVNDELIERVIGQQILYYPISFKDTDYHPVYGEAIIKTFLPPIRVFALIDWNSYETDSQPYGVDRKASINVHFHKRRLEEDQNTDVRVGDFVSYGQILFEIVKLEDQDGLFGQINARFEVTATCIKARQGLFDGL
jgi:hypothetical protein